jgi:hypothetical protein
VDDLLSSTFVMFERMICCVGKKKKLKNIKNRAKQSTKAGFCDFLRIEKMEQKIRTTQKSQK